MEAKNKGLYVRSIFDRIAPKYDFMNKVMSLGFDWVWRRKAALLCNVDNGSLCLDICTGSGKLAVELAKLVNPGGRVYALDISAEMLSKARAYLEGSPYAGVIELIRGDALKLPFQDNSFDCITAAWCLRNAESIAVALKEMIRVVKPGGKVVILDLSKPSNRIYRRLGEIYLGILVPALGQVIVGYRDPYAYMSYSLSGFPVREKLARFMKVLGLKHVKFYEFNLGMIAIHVGVKP